MSYDLPVPKITTAKLRERNACLDQIALFKRLFGSEVVVTVELAVKHADDFDFEWATDNLLFEDDAMKVYANVFDYVNRTGSPSQYDYDAVLAREFATTYINAYPRVP
jgi:6-phosphofructokinase